MASRIPSDAFAYYVSLGPERSYRLLAEKYGVTKRAVTKFAARESWSKRLARIEAEAREQSDKKLAESLEEMRSRHMKTLRAMGGRALEALKQHPLSSGMEGIRAAELVIRMERVILGEPSERTELSVEETTRREIQSLLTVAGEDDGADDDTDTDDSW